jgi:hypothetical protein
MTTYFDSSEIKMRLPWSDQAMIGDGDAVGIAAEIL